jgi:putative SOS response-associated peptidase YedK
MPVILSPEAWPLWLGEEEASTAELLALLKPCPERLIRLYPVDAAVGNVRNDASALLQPTGPELSPG